MKCATKMRTGTEKENFSVYDNLKRSRAPSHSQSVLPRKVGRKSLTVENAPRRKVDSKILEGELSTAQENGIEKEIMLQKLFKRFSDLMIGTCQHFSQV